MPRPASSEADEYSGGAGPDDDAAGPDDGDPADAGGADPLAFVAGAEAGGVRLDKWLAGRLPDVSRVRIRRWIGDGHVSIDARTAAPRDPVWPGADVRVAPQPAADEVAFVAEDVPLVVVHEDDALLVVDKPAGLVVHPAAGNWRGTVLNGLLHRIPSLAGVPRAGIVHRLDKDTSGLMVVAKTVAAQVDLVRQLQARSVGRTYVAIVRGQTPPSGRIAWPIGRDPRDRLRMAAFTGASTPPSAKPAATRFETLATATVDGRAVSFVVCRLETGRTHQIRVHFQALRHPLVGDATYGGARGAPAFPRQALHAWRLALVHPSTREPMTWTAAPPDDLATLARHLGFDADRLLASIVDG